MADRQTIDVYDRSAQTYADLSRRGVETDPMLHAFISACPAQGRVLDLGCGPGTAAGLMAQAGLRVDAIDASAEMVRLAQAQTGVNAWQARFEDIAEEAVYDGIWANFSLLHAPRGDFPTALSGLRRALHRNGIFHVGMKLGTGTGRDKLGRHYTYYTEAELRLALRTAGFHISAAHSGRSPGLDGVEADWICLRAIASGKPEPQGL